MLKLILEIIQKIIAFVLGKIETKKNDGKVEDLEQKISDMQNEKVETNNNEDDPFGDDKFNKRKGK